LCTCLFPALALAAEEPDGTAFQHSVISVDGVDTVRIRYCGVPLQVKLANLQFKAGEAEKEASKYLKDVLRSGASVKIELEPDLNTDSPTPPVAQVFAGSTHINLELVKRGLALSDGRSKKFAAALQTAQMDAMSKKLGVWGAEQKEPAVAALTPKSELKPPVIVSSLPPPVSNATISAAPLPAQDQAPASYDGPVVADLSSKEYHFPQSRYAKSIRAAARIEYKSPAEAERAGKVPNPFSFPDRAKSIAEKQGTGGGQRAISDAKKAFEDAVAFMSEARKLSKTNNAAANENWKKAAKLLGEHLDRIIPLADADPDNRDLQKLTEDMSMNLYSCKKYQSL
jgi:endonuclease YncB( thermonuclease family)